MIYKFLRTESFMAPSGIMMERDVYGIYPAPESAAAYFIGKDVVIVHPNGSAENYSTGDAVDVCLGVEYKNIRPRGVLFTNKNRKARRRDKKRGKNEKI